MEERVLRKNAIDASGHNNMAILISQIAGVCGLLRGNNPTIVFFISILIFASLLRLNHLMVQRWKKSKIINT